MVLHGKGFAALGPARIVSVRSSQKLPQSLVDPMPFSSEVDLQLAKAEPISDGGSDSGVRYLKREEKPARLQSETGMRICRTNSPADTEVSKERGEGSALPEQGFLCRQWCRPW